jgi:uncharacterized protein (TIGR03437 family)
MQQFCSGRPAQQASFESSSVTIDGKLAYFLYVSPGKIDLQPPDNTATYGVSVVVATAGFNGAALAMF